MISVIYPRQRNFYFYFVVAESDVMCGWGEGVWSMRAVDFTATPESYAVCPYAEHVTYVAQRCVGWARVNCPLGRGHGDLWPAARIGSLLPVDPSGARILGMFGWVVKKF